MHESGIQVHGSEREESAAEKIAEMLSCLEKAKEEPEPNTTHPQAMVATGVGLAALPKKLVEKIKANEYIDFTELPPAKGKSRPVPQSLEGQVLVVQAADLLQARKIIPDLATWLRCFALYVATLAPSQPSRVPEMMAYLTIIAKASHKYRWPSWIMLASYPGSWWAERKRARYLLFAHARNYLLLNTCSAKVGGERVSYPRD